METLEPPPRPPCRVLFSSGGETPESKLTTQKWYEDSDKWEEKHNKQMEELGMAEYEQRDCEELNRQGNHHFKHMMAMTTEGLHAKSKIAGELGWRDMQIDIANKEIAKTHAFLEKLYDSGNLSVGYREEVLRLIST